MNRNEQRISIPENAALVIKAHGNLDIKGWDQSDVGIITDINVQKVRHEAEILRLLFVEDCELSIPKGINLIIERASGDARIRDIKTPIVVNRVYGNLALQDVNQVTVSKIGGDCLIENIGGDLIVSRTYGNLKGHNISGSVIAEKVSGNVKLHSITGGLIIRSYGGIVVSLKESSDYDINMQASDNIELNLPLITDADLKVRSRSKEIDLDLGKITDKLKEKNCELVLGDGNQNIILDAGGRVRIVEEKIDPSEILKLFEDLDNLWLKLKEESAARRAAREKKVHWEISLVEGASQVAQNALDGVEKIADQISFDAIEQAEKHVRVALEEVEEQIRNLGYDNLPGSYEEEEDFSSEVTTEERLVIMRMLQEEKISVEEADQLLEILENPID